MPNIRYCAYNIGGSTDIAELVKLRPDAPGFDMLASKIDVSYCTHTHHIVLSSMKGTRSLSLKGDAFTCQDVNPLIIVMSGESLLFIISRMFSQKRKRKQLCR